jgi:hypothetical protein
MGPGGHHRRQPQVTVGNHDGCEPLSGFLIGAHRGRGSLESTRSATAARDPRSSSLLRVGLAAARRRSSHFQPPATHIARSGVISPCGRVAQISAAQRPLSPGNGVQDPGRMEQNVGESAPIRRSVVPSTSPVDFSPAPEQRSARDQARPASTAKKLPSPSALGGRSCGPLCVADNGEARRCQYRQPAPFDCARVAILVEALRDPNGRSPWLWSDAKNRPSRSPTGSSVRAAQAAQRVLISLVTLVR